MKTGENTLVMGIGNPLRSDDGTGLYVCQLIEQLKMDQVKTICLHQLQAEIIEDMLGYRLVIIADATTDGDPVQLQPFSKTSTASVASSHFMSIGLLHALALQLYNRDLLLYTCGIRGENFDLGNTISPAAKSNAEKAAAEIAALILHQKRLTV